MEANITDTPGVKKDGKQAEAILGAVVHGFKILKPWYGDENWHHLFGGEYHIKPLIKTRSSTGPRGVGLSRNSSRGFRAGILRMGGRFLEKASP